jgi:glycosyltransferase involved in cell wall biosynthesis
VKIALVTASFLPQIGGAEYAIHYLANAWSRQGHEVWVINPNTDVPTHPDALYKTLKYTSLRGTTRYGYHKFPFCQYAVWGIKKCLDKVRPEYISGHFVYPTGYYLSLIKPRVGYDINAVGSDITKKPWSERIRYNCQRHIQKALEGANRCIAISDHAAELYRELLGDDRKIVKIPYGADLDRFSKKAQADIRQKLNIDKKTCLILSVGRNHETKDYRTGIRAFSLLLKDYPNAVYLLVGPDVQRLESIAREQGVSDRVVLQERLQEDELVAAYQQSDIFLSCSRQELFPLVTIEAMASGRPIVVTNISGNQELAKNGKNGFIVEPGDAVGMADALFKVAIDPSLREVMSTNSKNSAKNYSWENISKQYLQCLNVNGE